MEIISNEESRCLAQAALIPGFGTSVALTRVALGVSQVAINLILLLGSLVATVFVGKEHEYHICNTGQKLGTDLKEGFYHIFRGALVESWWLPVVVMASLEPADGDYQNHQAKYITG